MTSEPLAIERAYLLDALTLIAWQRFQRHGNAASFRTFMSVFSYRETPEPRPIPAFRPFMGRRSA
jgi:hypothetical protein